MNDEMKIEEPIPQAIGCNFVQKNENIKREVVKEKRKHEGSPLVQYVAGFFACMSTAVWGAYAAWPSPAIPHLTSKNSTLPITDAQGGWIVSLFMLGDLIGGLINPLFIDRIGRKYTLLLFYLPGLIGWILIIFANNYVYLYIARLIAGIGQGGVFAPLVIYITEISEKNIRGTLVNMLNIMFAAGIFIFTSMAVYVSYETLNLTCASISIIFVLIFPLLPESPYYHLMRGRNEDAIKCLMKLRGIHESDKLDSDIREMKLAIDKDQRLSQSGFAELIRKSANRKGMLIIFCMKLTQFLSGIEAISAYAQKIFTESSPSINPGVQVMILNGISLLASLATNVVIDRFNRRTLFLSSGLLASICLGSVSLFFFMELYLESDVSSFKMLPLVALVLFNILYQLGFGIIPFIVQGEIFPINVKGIAVACGMVMGSLFSFGTSSGYNLISNAAGVYTAFFFLRDNSLFRICDHILDHA